MKEPITREEFEFLARRNSVIARALDQGWMRVERCECNDVVCYGWIIAAPRVDPVVAADPRRV